MSAYLGESQILSLDQEKACQYFVEAVGQFGQVPGLDLEEVGRLVQLIEMRPELQQLMYPLQTVFYVELVENGFTSSQKKELDLLRERLRYEPKAILSKKEVGLLKGYIAKAKVAGALSGFPMQERFSLFCIVQNHGKDFSVADVEILRYQEQLINGFSKEEIYELKRIAKHKKTKISLEEQLLVKRFRQVERAVGEGSLLSPKEAPR